MKHILHIIITAAFLGASLPFVALNTGCQTTEVQQVAQSLNTTSVLVEASLKAFGALNKRDLISQSDYDRVFDVYEDYQAAMNFAIDTASSNMSAYTPGKVLELSARLMSLITELQTNN